jgi:ABC-type phosphate transport system ATPase subunit
MNLPGGEHPPIVRFDMKSIAELPAVGRCSNCATLFHLGHLIAFAATASIFSSQSQRSTADYVTGRFG